MRHHRERTRPTQLISGPLAPRRSCDPEGGPVRSSPAPEHRPAGTDEVPRDVGGDAEGVLRYAEDVLRGPDELVTKIDSLVQPADQPENAVLVDESRIVRWTGPLFALFSLILLPWTIYLGESLPARQLSPHYDVAWAGFDAILLIGLATTAYFALRRSRYLAISASATAALLVVDAWFDV